MVENRDRVLIAREAVRPKGIYLWQKMDGHSGYFKASGELIGSGNVNKPSVWTVPTKPFKEAHFANYPEEIIMDCIKEHDLILGPFMGAVTTGLVAAILGRKFIRFELNPIVCKNRRKQVTEQTWDFW